MIEFFIENIPDIIGWIGNIFFLWGVYAIGKKNIKGFYSNILGNIMYVVQSILIQMPSLFALSVLLVLLNTIGILNWKKDKR